jgi:amidase
MTDQTFPSLVDQCALIVSGKATSLETTKKYIDRIERLNPGLNIVIRKNYERAIKRATELDSHLASGKSPVGPLHGVPFTIKDAFRIERFRTSYGFPGFNYLPAFDNCEIVDRLISAGGVFLGQTNVPLSCFDWQTNSPIYGLTRNPLDPERTVGGSSGGSAASLAAFLSPFEVGSDVAGSIRYPAHCCGVFGLRPTHDFVPFDDIGPALHKRSFVNLAVAGPITRSIDDMKLVLSVLTATTDNSKTKTRLKIAFTLKWSGVSADKRTSAMIEDVISQAKSAGHEVVPLTPKLDFDRCTEVWGIILGYEYKQMIPLLFRFQPFVGIFNYFFNTRRFHEGAFKESFERGLFARASLYRKCLEEAKSLRAEYEQMMREFDLWLTPVSAAKAIMNQKTGTPQQLESQRVSYSSYLGSFLMPTALLHHPILVAPLKPKDSELPIGIQLHGKHGQDWQLLADSLLMNELFMKPQTSEFM